MVSVPPLHFSHSVAIFSDIYPFGQVKHEGFPALLENFPILQGAQDVRPGVDVYPCPKETVGRVYIN